MKSILVLLSFFLATLSAQAQVDTASLKKKIYASLDSMIVHFDKKEWTKYVDYMHPKVLEMLGGKDAAAELIGTQMEALGAGGIIFKPGKVLQLVKTKDGYQGVIESFLQITMQGMTIAGSSYDVVNSTDGSKWYFTTIDNAETIKQMLPDLSADLKLPQKQMQPGITLEEFMKTYEIKYL